MKPGALRAIVVPLIVWSIFGSAAPPEAARPRGHPPPAVTLADDAPALDEILDAYVEACGGDDAIAEVDSWVVQASVVTNLPTWDPPVYEVDTLTVYSEVPDRYLIVHRTPRGIVLEGSDGTTTWKRDADGKVVDVGARGARDAWLVDPRFSARLRVYFPGMIYLGTAELGGRSVHVVEIDEHHSHRLYFDVETGLLARLGYNQTILHYGEVAGVKVPFEVEHSRKGGSSTYILESVTHNVPIDERLFSPPGGY